jgi:broad specificity phosphatase PhoE
MLCTPRAITCQAVCPIVCLIVCLMALASCGAATAEPRVDPAAAAGVKTIIVVRHAEADTSQPGKDPPLSADGQARALELARVLTDTPLDAVYLTHFQRNRQTAAPLPRHAGDHPTVVDEVPAILRALRGGPWGTTSLVIGHSNTIPDLIRGLTGRALPPDEPVIFDRMWIVTLARDGTASLLRLHYGAPLAAGK